MKLGALQQQVRIRLIAETQYRWLGPDEIEGGREEDRRDGDHYVQGVSGRVWGTGPRDQHFGNHVSHRLLGYHPADGCP